MKFASCILSLLFIVQASLVFGQNFNKKDSLSVYIFMSEDCVISQNYTKKLNELALKYQKDHIGLVGVFPNTWSKDSTIQQFIKDYSISFPCKTDHFKTLTKKYGIRITPEVLVLNHASDTPIYKGRIDNQYERIGKRRTKATTNDLEDFIDSWKKDKNISYKESIAVGCFINLNQ